MVLLLTGCSGSSGTPVAVVVPRILSTSQSVAVTRPSATVTESVHLSTPESPANPAPVRSTSSSVTSSSANDETPSTTSPSETTPKRATGTNQPTATTGPTQASADVNVAGPEGGPPCAVAKQYSDEAPTGLRPDVKAAWLATRKRAAALGVTLCLNDGKRSAAQQVALFQLYVKKYGTAAAHDYVLPPGKSAHVKGYAVDVQPAAAYRWLQATKGKLGWCRIYDNEAWHFEYSTVYAHSGCPVRQPRPLG